MTEEKITRLNEIAEMIPEVSKAKTNAYTSYINAQTNMEIDRIQVSLIPEFSEYIYKNISDICQFLFLFQTLDRG